MPGLGGLYSHMATNSVNVFSLHSSEYKQGITNNTRALRAPRLHAACMQEQCMLICSHADTQSQTNTNSHTRIHKHTHTHTFRLSLFLSHKHTAADISYPHCIWTHAGMRRCIMETAHVFEDWKFGLCCKAQQRCQDFETTDRPLQWLVRRIQDWRASSCV